MSLPKPIPVSEPPNDWLTIVLKLGAPAAIACYLVWQLATTIPAMAKTLDEHVSDSRQQMQLLHAICLILADTDAERAMCEVGR